LKIKELRDVCDKLLQISNDCSSGGPHAKRAIPRPRTDLGVFAARLGPLRVNGAAPRLGIEQRTIPVGATRQREQLVLVAEMVDHPLLEQALGDLLGRLVFRLERIDASEPNQIGQANLHGHRAAIGHTAVTHARTVLRPCFQSINVHELDGHSISHDTPGTGNQTI
jgi:hypothetical protein